MNQWPLTRTSDFLSSTKPGEAFLYRFNFPIEVSAAGVGLISRQRAARREYVFYWPFRNDRYQRRTIEQVDLHFVPYPPRTRPPPTDIALENVRVLEDGVIDANALRIDCTPAGDFSVGTRFVRLVRWITKQWWVERGDPNQLSYLINSFTVAPSGEMISGLKLMTRLAGRYKIERPLDRDMFELASGLAASGFTAPPSAIWLLDGIFSLATRQDLEKSVVEIAIACEMLLLDHVERAVRRRVLTRAQADRFPSGRGLDLQIRRGIPDAFGDSFAMDHPQHAAALYQLAIARGHVAHGKRAVVKDDSGLRPIEFSDQSAAIDAALQLMIWFQDRGFSLEPIRAASAVSGK